MRRVPDHAPALGGQQAPRLYGFSAQDVAWALTQVAVGAHAACTAILREHLGARRGHAAEQRKHVDSRSAPSLR